MSEHALVTAKASVMVYDDADKKWVPGGSSPGVSKVNIYHHSTNNAFRVVGRKLQDLEVVVNCSIFGGLKYNQATPTFHQWRDNRHVYGLNFISKEDADRFAQAMFTALDVLAGAAQSGTTPSPGGALSPAAPQPSAHPPGGIMTQSAPPLHHAGPPHLSGGAGGVREHSGGAVGGSVAAHNGYVDGREETRLGPAPTREEYRSHQRRSSHERYLDPPPGPSADPSVTPPTHEPPHQSIPVAPPPPPSAPPAPPLMGGVSRGRTAPAVPVKSPAPISNQGALQGAPASQGGGSNPPQPPPPPGLAPSAGGVAGGGKGQEAPTPPPVTNLAMALKNAQLRKVSKVDARDEPCSAPVHGAPSVMTHGGAASTLGRSASVCVPGTTDIMSEMARKLRDRRAKADGGTESEDPRSVFDDKSPDFGAGGKLSSANCAVDSPRTDRGKRFQSLTGQETFHTMPPSQTSGGLGGGQGGLVGTLGGQMRPVAPSDLETLKQEIVAELRREIQAAKQEIIDVILSEMSRR